MALNGFGLLLLRSSYSESEIMLFIENVKKNYYNHIRI